MKKIILIILILVLTISNVTSITYAKESIPNNIVYTNQISIPKITIYGDSKKNITSETLKRHIKEYIDDKKILTIIYDIIDKSTVNNNTNKKRLINTIDNSNYDNQIKTIMKDWIKNSLIIKVAYKNASDLDIFNVNSIKGLKNAFRVTIVRPNKISGYQIKYSKNKNFAKSKTIKVTSKKNTYTVKKLSSKKTYYVKLRAYMYSTKKHKNVYGNWTMMKVKTK